MLLVINFNDEFSLKNKKFMVTVFFDFVSNFHEICYLRKVLTAKAEDKIIIYNSCLSVWEREVIM